MIECLHIIVKFFSTIDGGGLSKDYLTHTERLKDITRYLRLQLLDTSKLILLYYQEMLALQRSLRASDYGELWCRAFYNVREETLRVDIFKCKNLAPMDNNGFSDPVIVV